MEYVPDEQLIFIIWMMGVLALGLVGVMVGLALARIVKWFVER